VGGGIALKSESVLLLFVLFPIEVPFWLGITVGRVAFFGTTTFVLLTEIFSTASFTGIVEV
jgi:hypothetical protein